MKSREQKRQSPVRSSYASGSHHYGRVFAVESALELDYLNLIRFQRQAEAIVSQPTHIEYVLNDRPRRYTPDFLVVEDGVRYIDEIKPQSAADKPEFRSKAEKLTELYAARGEVFRVFTENHIRLGHRAGNLRFLAPVLDTAPPVDDFQTLLDATAIRSASLGGLSEFLEVLDIHPSFIRRAVAHQLIQCDLTRPWREMSFHW